MASKYEMGIIELSPEGGLDARHKFEWALYARGFKVDGGEVEFDARRRMVGMTVAVLMPKGHSPAKMRRAVQSAAIESGVAIRGGSSELVGTAAGYNKQAHLTDVKHLDLHELRRDLKRGSKS